MNKLMTGVLAAGILLAGAQAFAGDTQTDHATKSQTMKDCMARMEAKNDGSSKTKMKAACKAEMNNSMSKDAMPKNDSTTPK